MLASTIFYHVNIHFEIKNVCCHLICTLSLHILTITIVIQSYIFLEFFVKKCGGMTRTVKVELLRNVSVYIVHGCLLQKKHFKQSFQFFNTKFSVSPQAKQFIDEQLVLKRKKSVATCTKHIFTAR